jgi:hypothetical protein
VREFEMSGSAFSFSRPLVEMRMRYPGLAIVLLLTACCSCCSAFVVHTTPSCRHTRLKLSESDKNESAPRQSRILGNQVEPTQEELEVMDEMITKLANAKPYELPMAVQRAFRVISSPRFFLRIAALADESQDAIEKEKLGALASNLVSTLDAVVSTAQDKLDDVAKGVETVVKAAAEPETGEFLVPLSEERILAMKTALYKLDSSSIEGDGFLSTLDAWMNKSHLDGMDLMVSILQKVLQMCAGRQIKEARERQNQPDRESGTGKLLDELLQTDADNWEATIRRSIQVHDVSISDLKSEVQRNMETIVLSLESGSISQQVQAEYLREMVRRIENVQKFLS